jgi:hypothetical protein
VRKNGTGGEETCGVVDGCVITCTWVELLAELNLIPGRGGGENGAGMACSVCCREDPPE